MTFNNYSVIINNTNTKYIFLSYSLYYNKYWNIICENYFEVMGIGDWGLGIGDWGLGPLPNPQSPIPNPHIEILLEIYYF